MKTFAALWFLVFAAMAVGQVPAAEKRLAAPIGLDWNDSQAVVLAKLTALSGKPKIIENGEIFCSSFRTEAMPIAAARVKFSNGKIYQISVFVEKAEPEFDRLLPSLRSKYGPPELGQGSIFIWKFNDPAGTLHAEIINSALRLTYWHDQRTQTILDQKSEAGQSPIQRTF